MNKKYLIDDSEIYSHYNKSNEMDKVFMVLLAVIFTSIIFCGGVIFALYHTYGAILNLIK